MFWFLFFFAAGLLAFHFFTKKYINPYSLTMVFGKKGSGKTTLLVKYALQCKRKGWKVYSTVPVPGCCLIDYSVIGHYRFPENSAIFIDEVGMIWDNRNFKNFQSEVRDWFKLQRHYRCRVYLFSQTFDVDKKLRDLTDEMILCKNVARVFAMNRTIYKYITITEPMGDSDGKLAEGYRFASPLSIFTGGLKFTYIPRWAKYFNSHEQPELPELPDSRVIAVDEYRQDRKSFDVGKGIILLRSLISRIPSLWGQVFKRKR